MTQTPAASEIDPRLLEVLVCPVTHATLEYDRAKGELISRSARLAYPIRDGVPVMLPEETCAGLRRQLHAAPGAQLTIDLESQTVTAPDATKHRFDIDSVYRDRLLKGLDEVGLVLEYLPQTEAFEQRHYAEMPWLVRDRK